MKQMSFALPTLLFLLLLSCVFSFDVQNSLLEDDFSTNMIQEAIANHINANSENGWTATVYPKFANYTIGDFKKIFGVKSRAKNEDISDVPVITHERNLILPKEFDARKQWPQCTNIGKIRDQGHCGCCWSFCAMGSLSDRFCIHHGENVVLSVNDPLACCGSKCGDCTGGLLGPVFRYAVNQGVVTEECYSYFDKVGCPDILKCTGMAVAPKCVQKCEGGSLSWEKSKHYADKYYRLFNDPKDIMTEVYKNGPVAVSFNCYLDFFTYKSGVYKHTTGPLLGNHGIKLIGWGTTPDGEDYWLLTNQWNVNWGENGLIRFKRGTNECDIERTVYGAMPSTKRNIGANHDARSDFASYAST